MNYKPLIRRIIEGYIDSPIDMLGIGDADGEYKYMRVLEDSYIRTIRDIDSLCNFDRKKNVLEIGSFLGVASIALKTIGYNVFALDIPEFYQSRTLRALYEKNGIPFNGVNLRQYALPYEDQFFDAVIVCEVIEHLNCNPLPVLKEINRVLRRGGYLYIATPNQAWINKRIGLLLGASIHDPIGHYFKQLDRNGNMIVGLHWREYVMSEIREIVGKMGFQVVRCYYFGQKSTIILKSGITTFRIRSPIRSLISLMMSLFFSVLNAIPSCKMSLVVISKKVDEPNYQFWLTEANS